MDSSGIWTAVLSALMTFGLGAITFLSGLGRTAVEAAVKAGAEEGAKAAVKEATWEAEKRRILEQTRGVERQELRFKSYAKLWACLRPLAIYSDEPLDRARVKTLSDDLTDWYFSLDGGMMMTAHVRDYYFTLQDLARAVGGHVQDWQCRPVAEDLGSKFDKILEKLELQEAIAARSALHRADLAAWPGDVATSCVGWRRDMRKLAQRWGELDDADRFCVLQQIGSALRTTLTNDVDARLR